MVLAFLLFWAQGLMATEGVKESDSLLFIERSKNKNQVHYAVKLNPDCTFANDAPVYGYWKVLEKGPDVIEELNTFDNIAYGIENQMVDEKNKNEITFNLKAIESKKITLTVTKKEQNCLKKTVMTINGQSAIIEKIYVFAEEGMIRPTVKWIDLFGKDNKNKAITERIIVDK